MQFTGILRMHRFFPSTDVMGALANFTIEERKPNGGSSSARCKAYGLNAEAAHDLLGKRVTVTGEFQTEIINEGTAEQRTIRSLAVDELSPAPLATPSSAAAAPATTSENKPDPQLIAQE